jgi:hypothetical protein
MATLKRLGRRAGAALPGHGAPPRRAAAPAGDVRARAITAGLSLTRGMRRGTSHAAARGRRPAAEPARAPDDGGGGGRRHVAARSRSPLRRSRTASLSPEFSGANRGWSPPRAAGGARPRARRAPSPSPSERALARAAARAPPPAPPAAALAPGPLVAAADYAAAARARVLALGAAAACGRLAVAEPGHAAWALAAKLRGDVWAAEALARGAGAPAAAPLRRLQQQRGACAGAVSPAGWELGGGGGAAPAFSPSPAAAAHGWGAASAGVPRRRSLTASFDGADAALLLGIAGCGAASPGASWGGGLGLGPGARSPTSPYF